jgi:hypothetical protein
MLLESTPKLPNLKMPYVKIQVTREVVTTDQKKRLMKGLRAF